MGITGSFEGWVPVATDLYYNGVNSAGFNFYNYITAENTRLLLNKAVPISANLMYFTKNIDVRSYSKLIFEGKFIQYNSSVEAFLRLLSSSSSGSILALTSFVNKGSVTSLSLDITQIVTINNGYVINISSMLQGSYITRIRLA